MSQWLPYLLVPACPLTMGVMMWLMMRGADQSNRPEARVAELESQVKELRRALERSAPPETDGSAARRVTSDRT
jgi:hypothetical protein